MKRISRAVGSLLVCVVVMPAWAERRLAGLDRLYFEQVGAPGKPLTVPADVGTLLPDRLAAPAPDPTAEDADAPLTRRDVAVPVSAGAPLWLREVRDSTHPRISTTYWALYEDGRRGDVWSFAAFPDRTGGKALSNYRLESLDVDGSQLVARLRGEMFRPGGNWWIVGKELGFELRDDAITLATVRNVFGFFYASEPTDEGGDLRVSTEDATADGYEVREVRRVPSAAAEACGFADPAAEDGYDLLWDGFARAARCLTASREATVTQRRRDEPSFIERPTSAALPPSNAAVAVEAPAGNPP